MGELRHGRDFIGLVDGAAIGGLGEGENGRQYLVRAKSEVLVERGYATIPIMAGSKAPGFYCAGLWVPLSGWQRRYLHGRTPNYMDHNLWGSGNAGIGVVGGKASHGLVAIDIDTDDPAIKVAIVKVLPPTPVRKIGAKGETAFYFGPDIMTSRSWNIDGKRVCDLIADGR